MIASFPTGYGLSILTLMSMHTKVRQLAKWMADSGSEISLREPVFTDEQREEAGMLHMLVNFSLRQCDCISPLTYTHRYLLGVRRLPRWC